MPFRLQDRLEILRLTLRRPILLAIYGLLQIGQITFLWIPPAKLSAPVLKVSTLMPWYGWVIGWLLLLWLASIEYSVRRKENFDKTSLNFFKAFLDFLIHQGHSLFNEAEDERFYSKINDWQHQVIQGIAIGLGPDESEKYYQRMDQQNPLPQAYRLSQDNRSSEPLRLWLQKNLKALEEIRMELRETKDFEKSDLEAVKKIKLIGDSSR